MFSRAALSRLESVYESTFGQAARLSVRAAGAVEGWGRAAGGAGADHDVHRRTSARGAAVRARGAALESRQAGDLSAHGGLTGVAGGLCAVVGAAVSAHRGWGRCGHHGVAGQWHT